MDGDLSVTRRSGTHFWSTSSSAEKCALDSKQFTIIVKNPPGNAGPGIFANRLQAGVDQPLTERFVYE
jgi:hypothetical protein